MAESIDGIIFSLNRRIKAVREEMEMTQVVFAEQFGVSRSYLSEIEAHKKKPSIELLVAIALGTEINEHWLLTGEGPKFTEDIIIKEDEPDQELLKLQDLLYQVYKKGSDKDRWLIRGMLQELFDNLFKIPKANEKSVAS